MKRIKLEGNLINLRLVEKIDAEFIINLRTNKELSTFISLTNINIEEQIQWIKDYKIREKNNEEFYFIVEKKNGISCGTVRIYNINYDTKETTWGSFILDKIRPEGTANEVIELSLKFILESLKLEKVYLEVRKENYKAIHIYEKNNFIRMKEDKKSYYYLKKL
ncbi:GNAT family N-acetyltransferase [Fusobacterium sp.]|uniref:GNAT family N-acetyltransferase n=1 Tax=Fusobacterium sp. TaxID=68766 RepID=UPI0026088731|nr:GNAT family N-acetyltransferase [Fusobacterium sp.]